MTTAAQTERRTATPMWSGAPFSQLDDAEVRTEFMAYAYEHAIDEPVTLVFMPREAEQLCLWLRTERRAERNEFKRLTSSGAAIEVGTYVHGYGFGFIPFNEFERQILDDLAAAKQDAQ